MKSAARPPNCYLSVSRERAGEAKLAKSCRSYGFENRAGSACAPAAWREAPLLLPSIRFHELVRLAGGSQENKLVTRLQFAQTRSIPSIKALRNYSALSSRLPFCSAPTPSLESGFWARDIRNYCAEFSAVWRW